MCPVLNKLLYKHQTILIIMEDICIKPTNQAKLSKLLDMQYLMEEHEMINTQMHWDRTVQNCALQTLYHKLRTNQYGWPWYATRITKPLPQLEIAPGVLTCSKCGSNKIITRTQQTRSGDEGQTVFALCSQCNKGWVCNN